MFRSSLPVRLVLTAATAGVFLLTTTAAASASTWALATDGDPVASPAATVELSGTIEVHAFTIRTPDSSATRTVGTARVKRGAVRSQALAVNAPAVSPSPCTDRARKFTGGRWQETFFWSYRARTTPPNLTKAAVIRVLKRSVRNIVNVRNDCGHPDKVGARAVYLGVTDRTPAPTDEGACAERDGHNVIGFGKLPGGIAGLTCVWSIGDRIIEADIKLDRRSAWAVSLASCNVQSMVEAVATHEFGHAFGLGHVTESGHGRLTMSERLDGYCQLAEATLGKGDWLGLEALY